jgi:hypothetical protein
VDAGGVALVGASDGSLFAVDFEGKPRFQLGVRGAVSKIEARPSGGFSVTTAAGEVIVDPAMPAPVEPPPRPPAPFTYLARPPVGGRAPRIVLAADDAWTLEEEANGPLSWMQKIYHFDGKTWTQARMAALEQTAGPGSGKSDFRAESLERGPNGQLVVVGLQRQWSTEHSGIDGFELRVFERAGDDFQERRDLAPAYKKTDVSAVLSQEPLSYAAGPGGHEIVCVNETCLARGLPPSFHLAGNKPPAPTAAPGWVHFQWPDAFAQKGRRATLFAGPSLFRYDYSGLTKDGKNLIGGEAVFMDIDAGKYPRAPDPDGPVGEPPEETRGGGDRLTQGLWASGPDDVWVSIGQVPWASALFRWNGKALVNVPCPLPWVDHIWGSGPSDVWLTGDGVAHYDGHEIKRILGVPPGPFAGGTSSDVWIGNWRVTRAVGVLPDLQGTPAKTPPISPPSAAIDVSETDSGLRVEPVALKIAGEAPLTAAIGIEEGPGGLLWLHDRSRLVELEGTRARVLHRTTGAELLDCQRCMAPRAPGEGAFLAAGPDDMLSLRALAGGRVEEVLSSPDLLAVASAPNGDLWAVSAAEDPRMARALVRSASGLRNVAGLPEAAYSNVAVRSAEDVWLSGGLVAVHDGVRAQPAGEGVLVHFDGHAFTRYRGPEGALLAVATVGPAEAWAVGLDGGIVHVKGGVASAFHLERSGAPLRVALRAVSATGPDDVWMAGDGSTLLHWNGQAFSRMEVASVGIDAALAAVIPPRDKAPGWLSGPRGIWRIARVDKSRANGP